jgi:hypothetical protein
MPREAKLWTETLIVMLIIAVMLVISGRFKQKRETFIADNKAETNASYEFTSGMVEVTRKFLTGLRRSRTATTTRKIDHGMSWDIMKMEQVSVSRLSSSCRAPRKTRYTPTWKA